MRKSVCPLYSRLIIPFICSRSSSKLPARFLMHESSKLLAQLRATRYCRTSTGELAISLIYRHGFFKCNFTYVPDFDQLTQVKIASYAFQLLTEEHIQRLNITRVLPHLTTNRDNHIKQFKTADSLCSIRYCPVETTDIIESNFDFGDYETYCEPSYDIHGRLLMIDNPNAQYLDSETIGYVRRNFNNEHPTSEEYITLASAIYSLYSEGVLISVRESMFLYWPITGLINHLWNYKLKLTKK